MNFQFVIHVILDRLDEVLFPFENTRQIEYTKLCAAEWREENSTMKKKQWIDFASISEWNEENERVFTGVGSANEKTNNQDVNATI